MAFQIQGNLSQRLVDVTSRSMLRVFSVGVSHVVHMAYRDARTFTYITTVTPTGPNDYFFYLLNTSTTRDLFINSIRIDAGTAETVNLERVTGTPVGGTAILPGNRNITSARTLVATAESAVDITGLTSQQVYERIFIPASGQGTVDLIERPFILPRGTSAAAALLAVTGAIALTVLIDVAAKTFDQPDPE